MSTHYDNGNLRSNLAYFSFKGASYLSGPLCFLDEEAALDKILSSNQYNGEGKRKGRGRISKIFYNSLYYMSIVPAGLGVLGRLLGRKIASRNFLVFKGDATPVQLDDNEEIKLFYRNLCGIWGKYPMSDGGLYPWKYRIENTEKEIISQKAHIGAFCEVFDFTMAEEFYKRLKNIYSTIIWNVLPKAFGASSGLFLCTNLPVKNVKAHLFPKESLERRNAAILEVEFEKFTVLLTHMQHSIRVGNPDAFGKKARNIQMLFAIDLMEESKKPVIFIGDHNMDDIEFKNYRHYFAKLIITNPNVKTWLGEDLTAKIMDDKKPSDPATLDRALILKKHEKQIKIITTISKDTFDPKEFKKEPISDHLGLSCQIKLEGNMHSSSTVDEDTF